ncbi:MAG TPA: glutamate-1-semialdehyde 2,1-aminomutase [Actinomycetota bacterium]|nr:glutamate-1-semialdehyde 2,1-aminomutase [Actinomycetota bacterium]
MSTSGPTGAERSTKKSEQAFKAALKVMPGGVSSPVRAFGSVGGNPIFMKAGYGSEVTDVDGNRYIDMLSSWGPLILGHANQKVMRAVFSSGMSGTSFGAPTANETRLAKMLVAALPAVDMVRFVSSGTEATMSALRLARAATGREKVLKFAGCYHGHVDALLVQAGSGVATLGLPDSPGVTRGTSGDTVVVPYNSMAGVQEAFAAHGSDLAAVIVEPVAANMGVVPAAPGFLEELRNLTEHNGSLLVFDEVVTGFRVGYSGAQGMFGITPDLTILGKVIGGGLPIGAYGGPRALMEQIAPSGPVYQAGTLAGNPMSVAAGIGTIRGIQRFAAEPNGEDNPAGLYAHLDRLTGGLADGLSELGKRHGIPMAIQRVGSMFTLFFREGAVTNLDDAKASDTRRFARFFHAMLEEGVYWPPSQFEAAFLSAAHSADDVERILAAAGRALERIG